MSKLYRVIEKKYKEAVKKWRPNYERNYETDLRMNVNLINYGDLMQSEKVCRMSKCIYLINK